MAPPVVAVVGSGLAGLSAALEASSALAAALPEARVVVFEKNPSVGGNSAKASSGINAVNAAAGDSAGLFADDTRRSGGGLSSEQLLQQLVSHSEEGLAFLEALGPKLSSIVRLGGHSAARTRSNPAGPNVGFALIKAVSSKVEAAANIEVLTNTQIIALGAGQGGRLSLAYVSTQLGGADGAPAALDADAVILASGGFGASKAMLQRYNPAAAELPTTNGPWATGDGIQLGEGLGAALLHMEQVQVHPTGFVDPADPQAGTKWLAPEKLRGCGALLLNARGERFVDELTTRDKVSAALMQQPGRAAWLLLGAAGAASFGEATLSFYGSKHMVTKCDDVAGAAQHMGVPLPQLQQQLAAYDAAAAAGADAFGKSHFPTRIAADQPVWVGKVTPVVHYCMGGLSINPQAQVLDKAGNPIRGLFAAGEVSGGLHGANRLGGNSLAECVVFGRLAGQQAAAHVAPRVMVTPPTQPAAAHTPAL